MDALSFGIALAGLISTTIASIIGIYFTHKARTHNYRDFLYQKQFELIVELMELVQLMELDAELVATSDNKEIYRTVYNEHYLEFRELERKGTVLLPVEIYGAVRDIFGISSTLAIRISNSEKIEEDVKNLKVSNVKFGLVAREFMGVDALSTESIGEFGNKKNIEGAISVNTESLKEALSNAKLSES
jgi:hypothetical protein